MPVTARHAVVILLDSLNRHMIGAYGGREFATPHLDRFASGAVRFDRHYTGSLPCMPARHDILCGALDFLWRCWGSVELWEDAITYAMRGKGVATQLISDHPHLFEAGGENYHTDFGAWAYERGGETDAWQLKRDPSWVGAPMFGRGQMPYDFSRPLFRGESDFPGPRTMQAAADWLDRNGAAHDRFFLFVDEFDPHEPFDTPEPWASMYDPDWEGPHLIWPPYMQGAIEKGVIDERQARQLRAGVLAALAPGVEGELLDLRTADRRVQVVVQALAAVAGEEGRGQAFQFGSAQGLAAAAVLVAAAEQAVDVLFQVAFAAAHGFRVAEQEQQARRRLQLAAGDALDEAVEQFDGRRLVAVDTGREQQIQAVVATAGGGHLEGAFGQPVQARAVGGELDLLGRLATDEGQVEQLAQC